MTSAIIYKSAVTKYCISGFHRDFKRVPDFPIPSLKQNTILPTALVTKLTKIRIWIYLLCWDCKLVHNSFKHRVFEGIHLQVLQKRAEVFRFKVKVCLPFCLTQSANSYNRKTKKMKKGKPPTAKSLHLSNLRKKAINTFQVITVLICKWISFHSTSSNKHMLSAD